MLKKALINITVIIGVGVFFLSVVTVGYAQSADQDQLDRMRRYVKVQQQVKALVQQQEMYQKLLASLNHKSAGLDEFIRLEKRKILFDQLDKINNELNRIKKT